MTLPVVSIIVPNYNHAAFLSRRIDSILNQTVTDIEIIILDDFSRDNSREIINGYASKDGRIKTYFNTSNSGNTFMQWRKGIDLAKAEYIWVAESDDFADHQLLEKLLAAFSKNPGTGLVYCQSQFINTSGEITGNHLHNLRALHPTLWNHDFCMHGREVLARFMPVINIIPNAGAAVFRRALCEFVDWDKIFEFKLAGDRFFWSNLLLHADLCFVAKPMNFFRMSDNTVRNRYHHTTQYLNEIRMMIDWICSQVNVSFSVKNRAVRQWLRHMRGAIRNKKHAGRSFYFTILSCFARLLLIYFKPGKKRL